MVTKLDFNEYLPQTLNYNEKKVQQGKAELIHAMNFLQEKDKMNFYDKFDRLENLNQLRPDVNVNTLHAKIAFHPTDKDLSDDRLKQIADAYMKKIGFEAQPYLVYKHHDTAIPHMHIVSTIVQPDGKRIATHNMGKVQSEQARKEIEISFGLEKAADHKKDKEFEISPVNVQKVIHGEQSSKEAMKQVIRLAMQEYKAGSLQEFNALLRIYNVHADIGGPDSRLRQHNGLQFKILDENGNTIGAPIKASAFYFKPTLKNLEEKFKADKESRKADIPEMRSKIDWILSQQPANIDTFIRSLKEENIDVLARKNKDDIIYGLTYIDHDNKVIINGSDLGKQYAANGILASFGMGKQLSNALEESLQGTSKSAKNSQATGGSGQPPAESPQGGDSGKPSSKDADRSKSDEKRDDRKERDDQPQQNTKVFHMLKDLVSYTPDINDAPHQLKKDKRQKRRKHQ